MEREGVYLTKIEFANVRCFGKKSSLVLTDKNNNWSKWTLILGDNGLGKTTILQCLSLFEPKELGLNTRGVDKDYNYVPRLFMDQDIMDIKPLNFDKTDSSIKWSYRYGQEENDINFRMPSTGGRSTTNIANDIVKNLFIVGYGANREISLNTLADSKTSNTESLFNEDAKLINAQEWLLQIDYAASKESDIKEFAQAKIEKIKKTLIDILPNVEDIRFSTPSKENLKPFVEFLTPFGWAKLHNLSLGYKTMIAWIVDLAARMFERYPDSHDPLSEPAIVLVDEIDLHLHPKWQRIIFDYLSDKFINTQFIFTAHSPLIVQSAPENANIILLRKEGNQVIIDNNIEAVNTWRVDQIMSSDLFGLSERSQEIAKLLEERKSLLQKNELSKPETKRLEELNKIVHSLPTANSATDIEAMKLIHDAASFLRDQKK